MEQPRIPRLSTAMVFNDMINANIRPDEERARAIGRSGLIGVSVSWVAHLRSLGVPIAWIRIERRADGRDGRNMITDASLAAATPRSPVVKGSYGARNIDELPVLADDLEVLKPRSSPFAGTDLDLQLRAHGVDTIMLGGISTNMGVESCARSAFDLDYNVVVVSDCCWAPDSEGHQWSLTRSLPRFARVMATAQATALLA